MSSSQLLNTSSPGQSAPNKALTRARVVAGRESIPQGAVCGPYPGDFKFGSSSIDAKLDTEDFLEIPVSTDKGVIFNPNEATNRWLEFVTPARDHHEQNCEYYQIETGEIFIRTLKIINSRCPLVVWYSDSLSAIQEIPCLGLQNIRGNQTYVCHKCGEIFQFPNPLKRHLRFVCKMPEKDQILFRPYLDCENDNLRKQHSSEQFQTHTMKQSETSGAFKEYSKSKMKSKDPFSSLTINCENIYKLNQNTALNLSLKDTRFTALSNYKPYCDFRTFNENAYLQNRYHPLLFSNQQRLSLSNCDDLARLSCFKNKRENALWFATRGRTEIDQNQSNQSNQMQHNVNFVYNSPPCRIPLPTEADGEPLDLLPKSFFENKSRKGHLCIYCGKLYSRKYGLKIHLRTHTGYKPLKCKVCLRPFGDPSNLNKHIRLHAQGETPYRCQHCGKVLVRRRDLERHIKSRHPTEPDIIEMF